MELALYSFFLVSVSIGTGCSFVSDIFFVFSFKNYKLKIHEIKILGRLQFACIVAASVALLSLLLVMAYAIESNILAPQGFNYSIVLILGIILMATMILRRFHLPALLRHQEHYSHLSDSFKEHHDALITTATLNFISWIFVVFLIALQTEVYSSGITPFVVFLSYIIFSYIGTQLARQIKGFYKAI